VQLDRTQIGIRERSYVEILDLSLHVIRDFFRPIVVTFTLGVVPLMLLNAGLVAWMTEVTIDGDFPFRYFWMMFLLVSVEAPLASVFMTAFMGMAVFDQETKISEIVSSVFRLTWRLVLCQGLIRMVIPVWVLIFFIPRHSSYDVFYEGMLIPGVVFFSMLLRSFRPFLNEMVVLEKNPIRSANANTVTVRERAKSLHGPSSGDLLGRWLFTCGYAPLLFCAVFGGFLCASGLLVHDWRIGFWTCHFVYPLSLWLIACFFSVARYLSYLDIRIRHEGWEVELKLRAASVKLEEQAN